MASLPPFQIPHTLSGFKGHWQERKIEPYSDGDEKYWPCKPYRPSAEEGYLCMLAQAWTEEDGLGESGKHCLFEVLQNYATQSCLPHITPMHESSVIIFTVPQVLGTTLTSFLADMHVLKWTNSVGPRCTSVSSDIPVGDSIHQPRPSNPILSG